MTKTWSTPLINIGKPRVSRKIKGIIANPMPKSWYITQYCETDLDKKIVADKKPYFFIYIYPELKRKYKKYIEQNEFSCLIEFGLTLQQLIDKKDKTNREHEFLNYYYDDVPVNISNSTMNKICFHIESEFNGYVSNLKKRYFDYRFLRVNRRCMPERRRLVEELYEEYKSKTKSFMTSSNYKKMSKDEVFESKMFLIDEFKIRCNEICADIRELYNIVLDLCYSNNSSKQFCWDIIGGLIIDRLKGEFE